MADFELTKRSRNDRVSRRRVAAVSLVASLVAIFACGYQAGWLRFSYPTQSQFPVRGIDVSHHQGAIDWNSVGESQVDFAFIKASEGGDLIDEQFSRNSTEAAKAGIKWGPYHFFTFCTTGAAQAENFRMAVGESAPPLPPAVDIEFVGNCANWGDLAAVRIELMKFLRLVESKFGRRPILYVTSRTQTELLLEKFSLYERWPRSFLGKPSQTRYKAWTFWQFAANGRVSGISGAVDLNVYCCSREKFWQLSRAR